MTEKSETPELPADRVRVWPSRDGLVVRHPRTLRVIEPGDAVQLDRFIRRRLRDGNAEHDGLLREPPSEKAAKAAKAAAASTADAKPARAKKHVEAFGADKADGS